ncbi:PREDICTED: uncharacterized protein LOC108546979 [Eufriesea mexicana]|uniref:uncharacterized protein LOC108546979 n=1 Tax=Eufriesea mexicana TaxID=516756 RepID=UPI00083BBD9F|nr:PREDICTED: uncharacterized protein LOC108546979 [Eufriesea mexicana]
MLQRYPKESPVSNAVSSDSKISLTNLRTTSSSLVTPKQTISIGDRTAITQEKNPEEPRIAAAKSSSTFVKTDQKLPVVDITWNYSSYRFETFKACLRNRYGDRYPPGEVVLNSMQLNQLDSNTDMGVRLAGLFDFLREDSEPQLNSRKMEIEYLNPLDHFVAKQVDRPATVERFTETDEQDRWHNTVWSQQEDTIAPVITGGEKNQPNRRSCRKIQPPCRCYLSTSRRVYGTNDS